MAENWDEHIAFAIFQVNLYKKSLVFDPYKLCHSIPEADFYDVFESSFAFSPFLFSFVFILFNDQILKSKESFPSLMDKERVLILQYFLRDLWLLQRSEGQGVKESLNSIRDISKRSTNSGFF